MMMGSTRSTNLALLLVVVAAALEWSLAFHVRQALPRSAARAAASSPLVPFVHSPTQLRSTEVDAGEDSFGRSFAEVDAAQKSMSVEEQKEKIGNLIADDEWMGLAMEMTEVVRTAVVQDVKKKQKAAIDGVKGKTTEFIGKDEYKVGDIAKTLDSRVKTEVAKLRGKDEYELGDLTLALDTASKDLVCEFTGKEEYETGDLAREVDGRIKKVVAAFCGKDEYEAGDLTREIKKRVKSRVLSFTGKDEWAFGDVIREVNTRRQQWAKDFLGEEAYENYKFGAVTKKALASITGKDEYKFGDVTKKVLGKVAGAVEGASPTI